MTLIDSLWPSIQFRLSTITAPNIIDLVLVTLVFFAVLRLVRRTQAGLLIRGVLALILVLLVTSLVLPLPTFDRIVIGLIITLLIATPITLQPELRRWLEQIGRGEWLQRSARRTVFDRVAQVVVRSAEALAVTRTGALIVIEGRDRLDDIVDSGVPVDGALSEELLGTLFFNKTPLHDGAVVVRRERVAAASCVLPLSGEELDGARRYGTRHRAAVGMSEASDALVVVVSEETGHISVAHHGVLHTRLDGAQLLRTIHDFYVRQTQSTRDSAESRPRPGPARALVSNLFYLAVAAVFAVLAWAVVINQTNPTREVTIEAVPLRPVGLATTLAFNEQPPASVNVTVRTTAELLGTLQPASFQATLALADTTAGLRRVPVQLVTDVAPVQVVAVEPAEVDLEIVPIITRTLPVAVQIADESALSVAYEVTGASSAAPAQAVVRGPQPAVDGVSQLVAPVSVANATSTIRRLQSVQAVDAAGAPVAGVTVDPVQVQVAVIIRRRFDARDVGIRAVTRGTPPDGYWLSSVTVDPPGVTLRGERAELEQFESFADTVPVDISAAFGELVVTVPLDLPPTVEALDSAGEQLSQVTVTVTVAPLQGDLLINRPITILNLPGDSSVVVVPDSAELLLSGPLPTLRAIEADQSLLQLTIDARRLRPGVAQEVVPDVIAPEGVRFQLVTSPVIITLEEP